MAGCGKNAAGAPEAVITHEYLRTFNGAVIAGIEYCVDPKSVEEHVSASMVLHAVYPNPFGRSTTLTFDRHDAPAPQGERQAWSFSRSFLRSWICPAW